VSLKRNQQHHKNLHELKLFYPGGLFFNGLGGVLGSNPTHSGANLGHEQSLECGSLGAHGDLA
jgi:hypothetical protein